MPSIDYPSFTTTATAGTALGVVTLGTTVGLIAGGNSWISKSDGSLNYRVKVLAVLTATTIQVRRYPTKTETDGTAYDSEKVGPPSYGSSDMSNIGTGTWTFNQERQSIPVDPAYSARVFP